MSAIRRTEGLAVDVTETTGGGEAGLAPHRSVKTGRSAVGRLLVGVIALGAVAALAGCELEEPVGSSTESEKAGESAAAQRAARGKRSGEDQRRHAARRRSRERQTTHRRRGPTAVIGRVIDGDTVELNNGKRVRLIGIDTPEVYGGTECGGPEASAYMKRIATGRRVFVRTDPTQDTYDRYGRLLAYLDAGRTDLGESLIRAGWAQVYVYDRPFKRLPAYRDAARTARAAARGISDACSAPKPQPAATPEPEPAPAASAPSTGADHNCEGYRPCLPPGPDVDCAGGSGNGPRYVEGPVQVNGSDPYGLDSDGDGVACE